VEKIQQGKDIFCENLQKMSQSDHTNNYLILLYFLMIFTRKVLIKWKRFALFPQSFSPGEMNERRRGAGRVFEN